MRALLLILLVACAKPAGGPLSHTFDNTKLAAVPLDKKQGVTEAQQHYDLAVLVHGRAETSSGDAEIEQETAELQATRAAVTSYIVAARQPHAKPATPSAQTAALARRTADAKVAYMKARRAWLGKLASSTHYELYAKQAKLELERVKVAQANHVTAADFNVTPYERQAEDRAAAAKRAAEQTAVEKKVAEGKLSEWGALEKEYLQASALSGPLESARFVEKVPAAPPSAPPTTEASVTP